MSSLFRPQQSFLQTNAWQHSAINALHYATSQQGSVIPIIYGTMRMQMNLIDLNGYRGPKGKKGKTGSLPLAGTAQTGKGGGDMKSKGGKKNKHYTVNVDIAVCQGPVTFKSGNTVFSSSGVISFGQTQLHFYAGYDGQAPDAHFNRVGYSGTCHVTGTPIDLGQSPVVPNLAFEITGFLAGQNVGKTYVKDANPADCILDFLTNPRYGAGFPPECISQLNHSPTIHNTFGDYCQSNWLLISSVLEAHMKALEWMDGICRLTNSTMVWSGKKLKIIPYADTSVSSNGATWTPDFIPKYHLTDNDFLPWHARQDGAVPTPGDDDPLIITRTSPADADNWVSIEYMDRENFYNSTILTAYDQGAIDTYGLRIGDSVPGRAFANAHSAQISVQMTQQRKLYIRNTGIKFQLGWQFALLEPMDFVSISGRFGDNYLRQYPVRITSIEENDNGDLIITGEDPQEGTAAPFVAPNPIGAVKMSGSALVWPYGKFISPFTGEVLIDPRSGIYGWDQTRPADSPSGTYSTWLSVPPDIPISEHSTSVAGFIQTKRFLGPMPGSGTSYPVNRPEFALGFDYRGRLYAMLGSVYCFVSKDHDIRFDNSWNHILCVWDAPVVKFWVSGTPIANTIAIPPGAPSTIRYSWEWGIEFYSAGLLFTWAGSIESCIQDGWWCVPNKIEDPSKFRSVNNRPLDLGFRGEKPLGFPPNAYYHYYPDGTKISPVYNEAEKTVGRVGPFAFSTNRAGRAPDYFVSGGGWASIYGDPDYPNAPIQGVSIIECPEGGAF